MVGAGGLNHSSMVFWYESIVIVGVPPRLALAKQLFENTPVGPEKGIVPGGCDEGG